jgi:DNA-binding CsgD family transcriptional regulator
MTRQAPALSRRQREVLELAGAGLTGKEAARALGLSPGTVQVHLRRARGVLGAITTAHAVALAVGLGLIDSPPHEDRTP